MKKRGARSRGAKCASASAAGRFSGSRSRFLVWSAPRAAVAAKCVGVPRPAAPPLSHVAAPPAPRRRCSRAASGPRNLTIAHLSPFFGLRMRCCPEPVRSGRAPAMLQEPPPHPLRDGGGQFIGNPPGPALAMGPPAIRPMGWRSSFPHGDRAQMHHRIQPRPPNRAPWTATLRSSGTAPPASS